VGPWQGRGLGRGRRRLRLHVVSHTSSSLSIAVVLRPHRAARSHVGHAHKVRVQKQSREGCVPARARARTHAAERRSCTGLAFHPTQPLLAATLFSGTVQLWNYRMGVLVDRFEEHDGERRRAYLCRARVDIELAQGPSVRSPSTLPARCSPPVVTTLRSKSGVRSGYSRGSEPDSSVPDLKPQNRRCLFTLHGHLDYVRTLQFHHEMPWIVCASCTNARRRAQPVSTRSRPRTTRQCESGTARPGIASPSSPGTRTTS
jgi:hypothetical protein